MGKQTWTSDQEEYLEKLYSEMAPVPEIAEKMKDFSGIKRSSGAIYTKLSSLGLREHDSKYTGSYDRLYDENSERGECTIDRIDVNGNYCPDNCRFVNMESQERNKRNNRYVTINNKKQSIVEWCEELNRNYNTVFSRIKRNWNEADAILTPTPTGYIPYKEVRKK